MIDNNKQTFQNCIKVYKHPQTGYNIFIGDVSSATDN